MYHTNAAYNILCTGVKLCNLWG